MKIAIIGTRGIPNYYGGFEQFAQYLAKGLTQKGFEVTVYNSHTHPYQKKTWNGVNIVHCKDLEYKMGTAGQFIYDLNCILDARKKQYDVILQLGYTSNSVWGWLLPKKTIVTTNMDGLEWKRTKYSGLVRNFLKHAEKLAVKYSDHLIADSMGIQEYLYAKYNKQAVFIPYGADIFKDNHCLLLEEFDLTPYEYDMLIARLEPENSIEIILDGRAKSNCKRKFLVVGSHNTSYGEYLKKKYAPFYDIKFIGGIYDINKLNNLRYYTNLYFHGHTVGGTNPSLLEAMASGSLVCANDNPFNRYILEADALYFKTSNDVTLYINEVKYNQPVYQQFIANNRKKIEEKYSWDNIINQYANHLVGIMAKTKTENITNVRIFSQPVSPSEMVINE
jgi:glycosyltransferase involved in cell wall biosynthesis